MFRAHPQESAAMSPVRVSMPCGLSSQRAVIERKRLAASDSPNPVGGHPGTWVPAFGTPATNGTGRYGASSSERATDDHAGPHVVVLSTVHYRTFLKSPRTQSTASNPSLRNLGSNTLGE